MSETVTVVSSAGEGNDCKASGTIQVTYYLYGTLAWEAVGAP